MPRRSSRPKPAEDPNVEKRVTRRSLRGAAEPDPPQVQEVKAATKSPSPSPRGRGRGRGRGAGQRGRGAAEETVEKATESEPSASQESEEEEEVAPAAPKKSPARGRGRGRGRGRASKSTVEDEAESKESEEVEKSPARPRRSRSAQNTPKKDTPTPTRRGRRGRSSAAAEEDEEEMPALETPGKDNKEEEKMDEGEVEEEQESPGTSKKRKRESVENEPKPEEQSEKKQKVEENEASEKVEEPEKSESVSKEEKEEPMEADAPAKSKEPMQTEEEEKPEKEEEDSKEVSKQPSKAKTEAEPAAKAKTETEAKQEEADVTEKSKSSKDEPAPQTSQISEPKKAASVGEPQPEKVPEAKDEEMDSVEEAEEAKEDKTEDVLKEYVVINMEDVPASDSAEVNKSTPSSAPKPSTTAAAEVAEEKAAMPSEDKPDAQPPATEKAEVKDAQPSTESKEPENTSSNAQSNSEEVKAPVSDSSEKVAEAEKESTQLPNSTPEVNSSISNGTITNSVDSNTDPLFSRKHISNPHLTAPVDPKQKFTLVSYNILADCHSLKNLSLYNWMSMEDLKMDARHRRFLQELQHMDADVICLQEVAPDYYNNVLKTTLESSGYSGCFMKRLDCEEGSATFYRTSRFQLCSYRGVSLYELAVKELETCGLDAEKAAAVKASIDRPTVVLLTQLKCNQSQKVVTVGNTHVSWDQLKRPDLQCIQVACAVKELVAMADGPGNAHVLCGDFNAMPDSPVYQLMKEGYLNDGSLSTLQAMTNVKLSSGESQALVNLWFKGYQHTSPNMRSSYKLVTGGEPKTTRYVNIGECREADYIWCGGSDLDVAGVLAASPATLMASGIPNHVFPSDHLSLKAELFFK